MATKVTPALITQMVELYEELGTYSAVARKVDVSASTAAKYIKAAQAVKSINIYSGPQPSTNPPILNKNFILTEEENKSMLSLLKEF